MKIKNNNYFKASGLYTIGSLFNKSISLLLLPIFTRLLSTSSYGIVSTYNSWVNIAVILVGVQFNITLRSAYSDYKNDLNHYIYSVNILSFFVCILFIAVIFPIALFFSSKWVAILALLCLLQAFFTAIINVEIQKQMMALEYIKRTLLLSLPNLLSALLGIIVIMMFPKLDFWGRIGSILFVYFFIGGYFFVKYCKLGYTKKTSQYQKYALYFSIPLIFHGFANVLLNNIDQTMITSFRGSSETGIYSVAYTMGMALLAFTSALEAVWIPWFTRKMDIADYNSINRVGLLYVYLGSIICCLSLLCMPEILKIFTEKNYWSAVYVLPPIMVASYIVFLFTISSNTEYYYKRTKIIAFNTIIAAISNVVLNIIFIPVYGATAAASTTVISYLLSFILHYRYARKLNDCIFNISMFIMPTIIVLFVTVITYLLMDNSFYRWILAASLAFISFLYYKIKQKKGDIGL